MYIHHAICTRPAQVHTCRCMQHMEHVLHMLECVSAHILHLTARACFGEYGSVQAMTAILTEHRCIKFPGFDKVWIIKSESDVVKCDDSVYIRMDPRSWTLKGLVCQTLHKDQIPKSLTASIGLDSLQRLRNQAQASLLAPTPAGPTLFDDAEHQQKKARISRSAIKTARTEASSLDISITVDGEPHMVQMLRPVHPRDNVFILYEPGSITTVVRYIRQCGFAGSTGLMQRARDPSLPQGIWNLNGKKGVCQVVYRKEDGTKGYKTFRDLESAMNWQTSNIAICTANGPDDDLHDEEPCSEHIADSEAPDAEGKTTPKTDEQDEQDEAIMDMHARASSLAE